MGTSADIEALVGWTGEAGVLTRSLIDAGAPEGFGFLEPVGETAQGIAAYRVHDLWHHAPDYVAKRRRRELDRQQKADPGGVRQTAPNGGHWSQIADRQNGVGRTPSPSPSHSPSPSQKNESPEAQSRSVPFLEFPIVGPGATTWTLSEAQVAEWASVFPGLDVDQEARRALAWIQANPGRRKTGRGMAKFILGWLSRTNDRGGAARLKTEPSATAFEPWLCPHTPECRHPAACRVVAMRKHA